MRIKKFNDEVLYTDEDITRLNGRDMEELKQKAQVNERERIRICAHHSVEDKIHEMLIVHVRDAYVRPHKHLNKSESFHIIEGLVDVIIFDDDGKIKEVIAMGDYSSGRPFYYRLSKSYFHTLIIHSDFLVFHETTSGPFDRAETIFAPWTPEEKDHDLCEEFFVRLKNKAEESRREQVKK